MNYAFSSAGNDAINTIQNTVKPLSNGHFGKFKWISPCIEVVLLKRFQSHYIDRGINLGI